MSKLAINGGNPVRTKDFPEWPQDNKKMASNLKKVLNSNDWGTRGPQVEKFEKRFAEYQDSDYGLTITNGTVTMEIALRALGIGYGDQVIVPPYSFNATVSAVAMVNATPVFVDIERDTFNIDPEKINQAITANTKAIIAVHVGGRPADLDTLKEIADQNDLYLIEDCAHAHGSEWKNKRVGSIGHVGSFSFQNSKVLPAGEGGFLTVNDEELYDKIYSIHHCGRAKQGEWYSHFNLGTNARMTEWQGAILNAGLDKIDEEISLRKENSEYLSEKIEGLSFLETMKNDQRITRNAHHLYLFKYLGTDDGFPKKDFIKAVQKEGIPVSYGYKALNKQPCFNGEDMKRRTGSKIKYNELELETMNEVENEIGMWLGQPLLMGTKEDIDDIVDAMVKVYNNRDKIK